MQEDKYLLAQLIPNGSTSKYEQYEFEDYASNIWILWNKGSD